MLNILNSVTYPKFFKSNSNETDFLLLELRADFTQLHSPKATQPSSKPPHEKYYTSFFLPKRPQCHLLN